FLAARHLNLLNISATQVSQLLLSPNDPLKAIPMLNEIVVWLSSMNRSVFDLLISHEPLLILRSNKHFSQPDREKIVSSLLKLSNDFEILDTYDWRKFYVRVKHTSLKSQLKPFIIDRTKNSVSRRIAIDIGGACRELGLIESLFQVLEAKDEEPYLRREAINSIGLINDTSALNRLMKYALIDQPEDTDDELKGSALDILYPTYISTDKMLNALSTVKRKNLYGAYKGFLDGVGYTIPDGELETAVKFFLHNNFYDNHVENNFESLNLRIIERCWNHKLSSEGLSNFAQLIYKMRVKYVGFEVPEESINRRPVVKSIIETIGEESEVYHIVGSYGQGTQLIRQSDWDWLVEIVENATIENQFKISRILWTISDLKIAKHVNDFVKLAFRHTQIRDRYKNFFDAIEIDSDEAKKLKEDLVLHATIKKNQSKPVRKKILGPSPQEKCRELIKEFSSSQLKAFWGVVYFLSIDESQNTINDLEFDITKLPQWNFVSDIHDSIFNAAKSYIQEFKPESKWILTDQYQRPELSGYKALLLLRKHEPEFIETLSSFFWEKWTATILYCSLNSLNELPEDRKYLLKKCFDVNQESGYANKILSTYLLYRLEKKRDLFDLHKIKAILNEDLAKVLLRLCVHKSCNIQNQEYILDFLLDNESSSVKKFAYSKFRKLVAGKAMSLEVELAILAASRLLIHPDENWINFWSSLKKNDNAEKIFLKAANRLGFGRARHIESLDANQRSEILIWLYKHFPPNQDPIHLHFTYSPSDRDNIADYRSQILRSLIEEGSVESVSA
ncbi:MAG TPA: hypothetical protein DGG95_14155, partial [Cytophagales bacterium]|nr:hypothetical protein [Cytophagales bacterium]